MATKTKNIKNFFRSDYGARPIGALIVGAAAWYLTSAFAGLAVAAAIGTGFGAAALVLGVLAAFYWKDDIKSWFSRSGFAHTSENGSSPKRVADLHAGVCDHNTMKNGAQSGFYWPKSIKPSPALEDAAKQLHEFVYLPTKSYERWEDRIAQRLHSDKRSQDVWRALANIATNNDGGLTIPGTFDKPNAKEALVKYITPVSTALESCVEEDLPGLNHFLSSLKNLSAQIPKATVDKTTDKEQTPDARTALLNSLSNAITTRIAALEPPAQHTKGQLALPSATPS